MARTTVNVADRGADDSGTKPINDVLAASHGSDRELYFPPGTYRLNPITLAGSNWSLVGEDATFVVPGHVDRAWLDARGSDWEIEGFTVDLRADGAAPTTSVSGIDWEVRNVTFRGRTSDPEYGKRGVGGALLSPTVSEQGAEGLLENIELTDGSARVGEASNRSGIRVSEENRGHLRFRRLRMEGWAHDTLDAENSVGPITVEDSAFRRTNVGVRLGGDAVVRNCVFVQDDGVPVQLWSGVAYGRGLWLNGEGYRPGAILVENCDFTMTGEAAGNAIETGFGIDHLTVRDCRFRLGHERRAIDLTRGQNSVSISAIDVTGDVVPPAIQVNGTGTATDVCTPHGYNDVHGLSVIDVQPSDDCLGPRTSIEGGPDGAFSHLQIATGDDPNYEFVVDGSVRAGPEADAGDVITRRRDGTTTVAGFVGHDDVDDFYVGGTVRDFRFSHRDPAVEFDDQQADLAAQPWELQGSERDVQESERREERVESEQAESRQKTGNADSERDDEGERRRMARYAGGGRVQGRRLVRGPGGEWSG